MVELDFWLKKKWRKPSSPNVIQILERGKPTYQQWNVTLNLLFVTLVQFLCNLSSSCNISPFSSVGYYLYSDSHTGRYSCKLDAKAQKKKKKSHRKYFVSKYFSTNDALHVISIFTMAQRHGCVGLIKNVKGLAACRSLPALGSSPVRQPAV